MTLAIVTHPISVVGYFVYPVIAAVILYVLRRAYKPPTYPAEGTRNTQDWGPTDTLLQVFRQFARNICPLLLLASVSVVVIARIWVGNWSYWDPLIVVGIIAFWPFQEWLVHVFILHIRPFNLFGRRIDPIIAQAHRDHHRNPWNPVTGLTPSYIIWGYVMFVPPFALLLLPAGQALTSAVTFFCLVLNYEWTHFLIHTSYVPKSWFYKRLWRNHRLHHFKNENYWFGVTMLSGDRLLHTQPVPNQTERSDTCLNLAVEEEVPALTELEPVEETNFRRDLPVPATSSAGIPSQTKSS